MRYAAVCRASDRMDLHIIIRRLSAMKKQVFRIESDGFNGAWYPAPVQSNRGLIIMLGDSSEDRMAKS